MNVSRKCFVASLQATPVKSDQYVTLSIKEVIHFAKELI